MKRTLWTKYDFFWVTLILFFASAVGHWTFAWYAYLGEQQEHGAPVEVGAYVIETMRDTLENWQSEFLQLMWQVGGLAVLYFIGSTQSKEGVNRQEAKIDRILRAVEPKDGEKIIEELDEQYARVS